MTPHDKPAQLSYNCLLVVTPRKHYAAVRVTVELRGKVYHAQLSELHPMSPADPNSAPIDMERKYASICALIHDLNPDDDRVLQKLFKLQLANWAGLPEPL